MRRQAWLRTTIAAGVLAVASVAGAQQAVSPSDIQRLQDQVYQAGSDISRLRGSDSSLAGRLESELDEVRDEVVYLKVKLRKDGTVNRNEYSELRDRLQDLRTRARGTSDQNQTLQTGRSPSTSRSGTGGAYGDVSGGVSGGVQDDRRTSSSQSSTSAGNRSVIPAGQEIDVRLQNALNSDTAQVEDRFEAITAADLYRGNQVLIPAGSVVRGVVSSVNRASRTQRRGELTLAFDQISIDGRNYPMRGTVTQALQSEGIRGEVGRIGAGSAVGAIIGGIIGGTKGALLGVLIGGGGTLAATEGKDVDVPAGTVLRVRLDSPPEVR